MSDTQGLGLMREGWDGMIVKNDGGGGGVGSVGVMDGILTEGD